MLLQVTEQTEFSQSYLKGHIKTDEQVEVSFGFKTNDGLIHSNKRGLNDNDLILVEGKIIILLTKNFWFSV